jgi:NAD(P)-dependent dehydrogenase (short-subunit alcohol dehydrogenase family)
VILERLRLDGRAVVVGGAGGGGIGTGVCVALAQAGATVVGLDTTELGREVATNALADAPGRHLVLDADLRDPDSAAAAVARAVDEVGALWGGVNVVGGMRAQHWARLLDDGTAERFDDVLQLNLRTSLVGSTTVARRLVEQGTGGSIVNIVSAAGLVSMPYGAAYGAAKAALVNLIRTMAVEWGRHGIRVNGVAPGSIRVARIGRERYDTAETDELRERVRQVVPLGRRGDADDIAGAVLYLVSDLASYVSGHVLVVDGGAQARAAYNDADNLPVFVSDPALRARLLHDA